MRTTIEVAKLPKGRCVTVGGYDVSKDGRTLTAYPYFHGEERPGGLWIELERLPETIYLVLANVAGEEVVVAACYSEAYALDMIARNESGGRVRSIHVFDAYLIERGDAGAGPVPIPVTQAQQARGRRKKLAELRRGGG